jgi:hypothetical protein
VAWIFLMMHRHMLTFMASILTQLFRERSHGSPILQRRKEMIACSKAPRPGYSGNPSKRTAEISQYQEFSVSGRSGSTTDDVHACLASSNSCFFGKKTSCLRRPCQLQNEKHCLRRTFSCAFFAKCKECKGKDGTRKIYRCTESYRSTFQQKTFF